MSSQTSTPDSPDSPPTENQPTEEWHNLPHDSVVAKLATSTEEGLTSEEVTARQDKYGYNQLEEAPPTSFWAMLWEQFNNFVVILLVVASLISAGLGEWVEAIAIMTIVILNAVLGIF